MKKISEAIKKIKDKSTLLQILKIKNQTEENLTSSILSVTGIDSLLGSLNRKELSIIKSVYSSENGLTLGVIEKKTGIDIGEIQKLSDNLSQKLLIYILKNRQHLTNRMDKVYGIAEIKNLLHLKEIQEIGNEINKISQKLIEQKFNNIKTGLLKDKNILSIMNLILDSGGIIPLNYIEKKFQKQLFEKLISELIEKSLIKIVHNLDFNNRTHIMLNRKFSLKILNLVKGNTKQKINTHNRFNLVLNLLFAFDTISTYGLFLTKQKQFRKIDKRRIEESLIKIKKIDGNNAESIEITHLSLFLLNLSGCLKMKKDIAYISLKQIENEIPDPHKLLIKIINSLKDPKPEHEIFPSPFKMPSYNAIMSVLKIFYKIKTSKIKHFETILLTKMIATEINKANKKFDTCVNECKKKIKTLLNFLCYTGIICIKNSEIMLSDIGLEISAHLLKIKPDNISSDNKKDNRSIYINPDLTLIIPAEELTSLDLYHLLTHTEIEKYDIILHTIISKQSIINANKRGLPIDTFVNALKKYSKNEIPQNLDFLLSDWSKQIIKLTISEAIFLKTNHPSFIDEIIYSKYKDGIIERISPNYAIIDKKYLDIITGIAKKSDAVISLFENSED